MVEEEQKPKNLMEALNIPDLSAENVPQFTESLASPVALPSLDELEEAAKRNRMAEAEAGFKAEQCILGAGVNTNDETTVQQYFAYYAKLSNQQNMMQDSIRTSTYREGITGNKAAFKDKIVMDVGAGSGLLSIFAVQAGAKKVYAVEASNMAEHAKTLIKANGLQDKIEVICSRIEDIPESQLGPESIDVIVSEPLGTYLFNERMLETYIIARDRFLKKSTGMMFPKSAHFCIIPFEDKEIYEEQVGKVDFWTKTDFHGFDLSCMHETAVNEKLSQPILDTYDAAKNLSAQPVRKNYNFENCTLEDLKVIDFNFQHEINRTGICHGYCLYFEAFFRKEEEGEYVILKTGPEEPQTHWYQTRILLKEPIGVTKTMRLGGSLKMRANNEQSFDAELELQVPWLAMTTKNQYDMKDLEYRGAYLSYYDYYNQPAAE